jgi:hypothetical protein
MVWTGLIWLRIGTSGELLWIWYWSFSFDKMLGGSWVAAPQEGLSSVSKITDLGSLKLNVSWWKTLNQETLNKDFILFGFVHHTVLVKCPKRALATLECVIIRSCFRNPTVKCWSRLFRSIVFLSLLNRLWHHGWHNSASASLDYLLV